MINPMFVLTMTVWVQAYHHKGGNLAVTHQPVVYGSFIVTCLHKSTYKSYSDVTPAEGELSI